MTKIVWNGVDGYVEADQAKRRGYDFEDGCLYTQKQMHWAFEVGEEVSIDAVPLNEYGEHDCTDFHVTETGKIYRKIK